MIQGERTRRAQFSSGYRGVIIWNEISANIKDSSTLENFKAKLKEYLFSRYCDVINFDIIFVIIIMKRLC